MKTLLVLRHAKSSWKDADLDDHDRPLNKRGRRDAPRIGEFLSANGLVPELVLSSTAKRARKTAEIVTEVCGFAGELKFTEDLYHAGPRSYFDLLRGADEKYRSVMIVGHNPSLEEFLTLLLGEFVRLPTAALAQIELGIERWSDFAEGVDARLVHVWSPKELD